MTLTRDLETLFFILLASAIGLFGVFYLRQPKNLQPTHITLPTFIQTTPTPTPTIVPSVPKTSTVSWNSSDGEKKIVMQTTFHTDTSKTYDFTLHDVTKNTDTPFFTKTVPSTITYAIPFNAFSPDNSYFYLEQIENTNKEYFVFKGSTEAFADGSDYIDVNPLFAAYTSNYILTEATGWADNNLLIINSKTTDDKTGPSFWFDLSSKSFIHLSTLFE